MTTIPEILTQEELESVWAAWKIRYLLGDDKCEFDPKLGKLLLEVGKHGKEMS